MPYPVFWKAASVARTNVTRSMTDSLTLSASSVVRRTVRIQTAASIAFSDTLALQEDTPIIRSMTDSITLAGASVIRRTVQIVRAAAIAFADTLGLTEQAPTQRTMTDSITLSASSVIRRTVVLARSAAISFADSLSLTEDDQSPAAPTNLNAVESVNVPDVDLTWTDNADNEDDFEIWRSTTSSSGPFTQVGTNSANDTTFTDDTTALDTTYWYRVRATNSRGESGWSNTVEITTSEFA